MNDITKCPGTDCLQKDTCYRFTAKADLMQSWFMEAPAEKLLSDGTWGCEYYWPLVKPTKKKAKKK